MTVKEIRSLLKKTKSKEPIKNSIIIKKFLGIPAIALEFKKMCEE